MVMTMMPTTAFAADAVGTDLVVTEDGLDGFDTYASTSTVVLHWSTSAEPTGFKVKVGDKINGYLVTKVGSRNGYEITIDLGKYNVHLDSFRIPLPEEVWTGVKMQYNPQTYVSAATSGAQHKTPGSSALLGNGRKIILGWNELYISHNDSYIVHISCFCLLYDTYFSHENHIPIAGASESGTQEAWSRH